MTDLNDLKALRIIAKRLARAARIPHHQALDIVAVQCSHPHWNALTVEWDKGWRPSPAQLAMLESPHDRQGTTRSVGSVETGTVRIAGATCELEIGFDYVLIGCVGAWCIHLGHAPSEPAGIEKYVTPNPLDDTAFLAEVMKVASAAADIVREEIARDWPRRSTKPDAEGRTTHPLFGGISADWYCLHCDGKSTGKEMAMNMWHCPKCGATPIDMHPSAWWKEALPST